MFFPVRSLSQWPARGMLECRCFISCYRLSCPCFIPLHIHREHICGCCTSSPPHHYLFGGLPQVLPINKIDRARQVPNVFPLHFPQWKGPPVYVAKQAYAIVCPQELDFILHPTGNSEGTGVLRIRPRTRVYGNIYIAVQFVGNYLSIVRKLTVHGH